MPTWKEGDRIRVVTRPVTDDDRKKNRYFAHMGGLLGTVQNVYSPEEIAISIAARLVHLRRRGAEAAGTVGLMKDRAAR